MSLLELLTSRDAVLAAIREFDELGRNAFLEKYGFGPAKGYFVEYEGRFYDSKALAGAAVGFEHPERGPLKNSEFSGGDATVRPKLQDLRFNVVSYADRGAGRRWWWVNQGATYDAERTGGYVWAPQHGDGGRTVGHHRNVAQLRPGDVIVHYARGLVRAAGVVESPPDQAPRPAELPEGQWAKEGYLAKVAYHDAPTPVALEEIPASWRTEDGGPFTRHGSVKQGYLFPLSLRFVRRFVGEFGTRWPGLADVVGETGEEDALDEFLHWGRLSRSS